MTKIKTMENPISVRIDEKQIEELKEQLSPIKYVWIYVISFLVIIILFISIELSRKKNEAKLEKERYLQGELQLKTYIISNLKRGYTAQQLKNELLKDGWDEERVNRAFQNFLTKY